MSVIDRPDALAATAVENGIVAVSLELSRSKWLVTSLLPGSEKLSKHMVAAGDGAALLSLLERRRRQAEERVGGPVRVVAIEEAGLDGFWLHRLLEANGIESHVVDAASVAVSRRRRRGKSDGIDGETLLRTLLAWRRGEPRVCSMVRPPRPQEEDRRRVVRERAVLIRERIAITNRVRGLLMSQGITDYQPLRRDRRARLETLMTGDGRALAPQMKRELERALDRLDLLVQQLKAVEAERDAMQEAAEAKRSRPTTGPNCCCAFARSDRKPPPCSRSKRSTGTSTIDARSPPSRVFRRARGRAVRSSTTRASPKRDSRSCARPWSNSPGCGGATSRAPP